MKKALRFSLNVTSIQLSKPLSINCKMIIAYLGRNVKEYCEIFLFMLEKLIIVCPQCSSKTVLHGCYDRHVHIGDITESIIIQRVICCNCGRTHAIIPDFIKPFKHYSAADIELTLRDVEDEIPVEKIESAASVTTIKRWAGEFKRLGKSAVGGLRAILKKFFDKTINDIEIIGIKTFVAMERVLGTLPEIESSGLTIGEANQWLTSHMPGVYV